ncbi:PAS domain S-box protein [Verrucomicrobiota bacterium]
MADKDKLSKTMRIDLIPDVPTAPESMKKRVLIASSARKHKRIDLSAKGKKSHYQELLQSIYDAAFITDQDGRITDCNVRALEFLQYVRKDLIGLTIFDVISGSDESLVQTLWQNLENERFTLIQAYCVRKDGSYFPAEISVNKLKLEQTHLCFFVRDITLRRQAEEMLRTEHSAIQNSVNGIVIADMNADIEYANPATAQMWGFSSTDELIDQNTQILFENKEMAKEMIDFVIGDQKTWTGEMIAAKNGGGIFDVQISAACNRNSDGEPVGVIFSFLDISVHKRAEEKLQEERALLRTLIDNLPSYIFVKDTESRFMINNLAHMHVLGAKTQEELTGKSDFDIFPEELAVKYREDEQAVMKTGEAVVNKEEYTIDQETGVQQWLATTKIPLRNSAGEVVGLVGMSWDVTDRKRAEEAEKETERQRVMLESLGAACHHLGQPATVLLANIGIIQKKIGGDGDAMMKELVDSSIQAAEALGDILHKLNAVNEYKTTEYLKRPEGSDAADSRILDI